MSTVHVLSSAAGPSGASPHLLLSLSRTQHRQVTLSDSKTIREAACEKPDLVTGSSESSTELGEELGGDSKHLI